MRRSANVPQAAAAAASLSGAPSAAAAAPAPETPLPAEFKRWKADWTVDVTNKQARKGEVGKWNMNLIFPTVIGLIGTLWLGAEVTTSGY